MTRMLRAGALAGLVLLAGCATATIGKPFPANNVALLRTGISTTAEARSLLGEPHQVQTNQFGETWYIWQYIRSDATAGLVSTNVQTSHQQAILAFGPDGRLLRAQQLINVPAPIAQAPAQAVPATSAQPGAVKSQEQQLQELQSTPMSYEEYQRRYREIMGQ
ncbi:hypothetical protein [Zestomonas carbonaria]|nr:hypothetical protein [Pseudomonas carbonaria]